MDDLFISFAVGNYLKVIKTASNPSFLAILNASDQLKARVYLYRAYLHQGLLKNVIKDITPQDADSLIAVQLLAMYLASVEAREQIVAQAKQVDEQVKGDSMLACILAIIFALHKDYNTCLEIVSRHKRDQECVGVSVQALLAINRPDLAAKEVEELKNWSNDSIYAQIVESWVAFYVDDPVQHEDTFYLYQELINGENSTSKTQSGNAITLMQSGKYSDAESILLEAIKTFPNDSGIVANLLVAKCHLNKPQSELDELFAKLSEIDPMHPMVTNVVTISQQFNQALGIAQ